MMHLFGQERQLAKYLRALAGVQSSARQRYHINGILAAASAKHRGAVRTGMRVCCG